MMENQEVKQKLSVSYNNLTQSVSNQIIENFKEFVDLTQITGPTPIPGGVFCFGPTLMLQFFPKEG